LFVLREVIHKTKNLTFLIKIARCKVLITGPTFFKMKGTDYEIKLYSLTGAILSSMSRGYV